MLILKYRINGVPSPEKSMRDRKVTPVAAIDAIDRMQEHWQETLGNAIPGARCNVAISVERISEFSLKIFTDCSQILTYIAE